jgi:hypothetical protein
MHVINLHRQLIKLHAAVLLALLVLSFGSIWMIIDGFISMKMCMENY